MYIINRMISQVKAEKSEVHMKPGKWRWLALWAVIFLIGSGCELLNIIQAEELRDVAEDVAEDFQKSDDREKTRKALQGVVVGPTLTQIARTRTPEILKTYVDVSKCNAFSLVEVKLVLIRDGPGVLGTRDCEERLEVTNLSDQVLILFKHFVIEDPAYPHQKPQWSNLFLKPGQTLTQSGGYGIYSAGHSQAGKYRTWYTNQIAVTLASCFPEHIQDIPPATISWFSRDVPYHCSP